MGISFNARPFRALGAGRGLLFAFSSTKILNYKIVIRGRGSVNCLRNWS